MNREKIILFVCLILFLINSPIQAVQILESKVISKQATDCDMHLTKIIFNDSNDVLITMNQLLYANNNLIRVQKLWDYENGDVKGEADYCCYFLGGFVKDNKFYVAFDDVHYINIFSINKNASFNGKKLEVISQIKPISVFCPDYTTLIYSPDYNGSCYLLGHPLFPPANPIGFVKSMMDAYAQKRYVYYYKPRLAEIKNGKMVRTIDFDYGCKIDESYVVNEVAEGKDSIHFFGYRNIDGPYVEFDMDWFKLAEPYFFGYDKKKRNFDDRSPNEKEGFPQAVILYYADYNLNKGKNVRKCKIYEDAPGYNEKTDTYFDYGVLSADSQDDNVYAVFSWVKWQRPHAGATMVYNGRRLEHRENFSLNDVNSSIYYWQCNGKSYGKAEKIAEGFCPIIKVDQFGSVHIFWVDRSGNIIQKIRKDNKWSDEEIVLKDFSTKPAIMNTKRCSIRDYDRPEAILYTKFVAAEFDNENNLHIVYPTAEGIVYTKLKLE
jgi:hypothetical protein